MANMLEILIQTISKDIDQLTEITDAKLRRKESSFLKVRIDSALKLVSDHKDKVDFLEALKRNL